MNKEIQGGKESQEEAHESEVQQLLMLGVPENTMLITMIYKQWTCHS